MYMYEYVDVELKSLVLFLHVFSLNCLKLTFLGAPKFHWRNEKLYIVALLFSFE